MAFDDNAPKGHVSAREVIRSLIVRADKCSPEAAMNYSQAAVNVAKAALMAQKIIHKI